VDEGTKNRVLKKLDAIATPEIAIMRQRDRWKAAAKKWRDSTKTQIPRMIEAVRRMCAAEQKLERFRQKHKVMHANQKRRKHKCKVAAEMIRETRKARDWALDGLTAILKATWDDLEVIDDGTQWEDTRTYRDMANARKNILPEDENGN
jgi:hypothetical protein